MQFAVLVKTGFVANCLRRSGYAVFPKPSKELIV